MSLKINIHGSSVSPTPANSPSTSPVHNSTIQKVASRSLSAPPQKSVTPTPHSSPTSIGKKFSFTSIALKDFKLDTSSIAEETVAGETRAPTNSPTSSRSASPQLSKNLEVIGTLFVKALAATKK